jgi:hypothetical protein
MDCHLIRKCGLIIPAETSIREPRLGQKKYVTFTVARLNPCWSHCKYKGYDPPEEEIPVHKREKPHRIVDKLTVWSEVVAPGLRMD